METKTTFEYHCDKETFLKLKELNKLLNEAKHAYARWFRAKRKTVHKKPLPDLSKYNLFIKEFPRGKCPYKQDWKNIRSHKSRWLKDEEYETGAYIYMDDYSWTYSWNLTKKERGEDFDKEKSEDTWIYLDTHYIEESYQVCKRPMSEENINPPKLSKRAIELLHKQAFGH